LKRKQPLSIVEHKEARAQSATLSEIETLRIRAALARVNELTAVTRQLEIQLLQARANLKAQLGKAEAMRNAILELYGFELSEMPNLEIDDTGELITISLKRAS
jgi:hypothetical protein